MRTPPIRGLGLLAALAIILAACATDDAAPTDTVAPTNPPAATDMAAPTPDATVEPTEDPGTDGAPMTASVPLLRFQFSADTVTIAAGGTVTFSNGDSAAHTVTEGVDGASAPDARFDETIGGGESVQVTFDEPGTYQVTCRFHPSMNMTVIVEG